VYLITEQDVYVTTLLISATDQDGL